MKFYSNKKDLIKCCLSVHELKEVDKQILTDKLYNNPIVDICFNKLKSVSINSTAYYMLENILIAYVVERVKMYGKGK